jgi:hypothetical protein
MSLENLAQIVRQLQKHYHAVGSLDEPACARLVLLREFGVKPTSDGVAELSQAVQAVTEADAAFFGNPSRRRFRNGRRVEESA